jgi:hypothetical protein
MPLRFVVGYPVIGRTQFLSGNWIIDLDEPAIPALIHDQGKSIFTLPFCPEKTVRNRLLPQVQELLDIPGMTKITF